MWESKRMTRFQHRRRAEVQGSSSSGNPNKSSNDQPLVAKSQDCILNAQCPSVGDLQPVELPPHPSYSAETCDDSAENFHDEQQELIATEPVQPAPNTSSSNQQGASTSSGPAQVMRVMRCTPSDQPQNSHPSSAAHGDQPVLPARVMRCPVLRGPNTSSSSQQGASTSSGPAQVMRVMRCAPPGQSVSEHSHSSSAAHDDQPVLPARVMRCPVLRGPRVRKSEFANFLKSRATESALCEMNVSGSSSPLNNAVEPFSPPASSSSSMLLVKEPSEEIGSSEGGTAPSAESTVLKCRSGRSSYSLRALKSIPYYCEKVFSPSRKYDDPELRKCVVEANNNYNNTNNNQVVLCQSEKEHSFVNQLPNEILCLIFSYVPNLELLRSCSRVCHRWSNLVKCPLLWQSLTFRGQDVPINLVGGLIKFSPLLKSITIKDRSDVELILPVLHQQCKRLESVNLIRCRPSDGSHRNLRAKSLYPFLRKGQLRSLNLKGTDYKSRKFYQMLGTMPNLRKLDISCSKSVSPQILTEIAKHSSLKVFKSKWHSRSIYHGPKSMTIQLPGKIDDWASAYNLLLQNAGQNLTTLEFFAAGINDVALASLASCKKLKKLSIYNGNLFGGESMSAVSSLTMLQELLIHNAKLSADDVISAFQTGNLSDLKCLHLNDSVLPSNANASADNCLEMVARKCQKLQHLSFTKCPDLTDLSVRSLLMSCSQLLSLDLNGALGVTGQAFLLIPTSSPRLNLLIIEEDCSEMKSKVIKNLVESHGVTVKTVSTWKHRTKSYYL